MISKGPARLVEQHIDIVDDLREYYEAAARSCAKGNCLGKLFQPQEAFKFVRLCRHEVYPLNSKQKKDYLREKIRTFSIRAIKRKEGDDREIYMIKSWIAGAIPDNVSVEVCKECFCKCYDIGTTYLALLIKSIKEFSVASDYSFNDGSSMAVTELRDALKTIRCDISSGKFNNEDNNRGIIPFEDCRALLSLSTRSPGSVECMEWMRDHFDTVGERTPNGEEIHIDPQEKYDTYNFYVVDCELEPFIVSQQVFYKIWRTCFPHVRLRQYKAVCGKCCTCARLSLLRTQIKTEEAKEELRALWSYHKITFMRERQAYTARKVLAKSKDQYISLVIDGMSQNHMLLPWYGNQAQSTEHLKQKMNGVLCHEREFVGYRCYNNIRTGANFTIHCIASMLEKILEDSGTLPDTVFIQFDGASENANVYVLAFCELLIINGLTKKVVVTRLMVGHTHCDADGIFGIIWKKLWKEIILTPQQYKEAIEDALRTIPVPATVEDVMVLADFVAWLKPHIDPKLSRLFKEENTQLQFIFEATEDRNLFPNGVKMQYRAFSSDQVFEIIKNPTEMLGLEGVLTDVATFPEDGMYVLQTLPDPSKELRPAPFVEGSYEELTKVSSYIKKEWNGKFDVCVKEWNEHLQVCPYSDDAQDYVRRLPKHFKIPLHNQIFSNAKNDFSSVEPVVSVARKISRTRTTASVHWSNRGIVTEFPPPREYLDPENGTVLSLNSKNAEDTVELPIDLMSKKQLMDKCKELGLTSTGSTKAVLIKRLKNVSIEGVLGLSSDKYIQICLSYRHTTELKELALVNKFHDALSTAMKANITNPDKGWRLELMVKHDREFYHTIKPDGTCGFLMDYVMTTYRHAMTVEQKNEMPTHHSYIDLDDKDAKKKVLDYAISVRDAPVRNPLAFDRVGYIDEWNKKINGFIDFLKHYTDSTNRLSDSDLWFSTQSIDLFRQNDVSPYSLFQYNSDDNVVYSKFMSDTRYMNRAYKFTYSELREILITNNFAVLADCHYYPYRAYHNLTALLDEAVEDLCVNLSSYLLTPTTETVPSNIKSVKSAKIDVVLDHDAKLSRTSKSIPKTVKAAKHAVVLGHEEDEFSCGDSDSDYEFANPNAPVVDCLYTNQDREDDDYIEPVDKIIGDVPYSTEEVAFDIDDDREVATESMTVKGSTKKKGKCVQTKRKERKESSEVGHEVRRKKDVDSKKHGSREVNMLNKDRETRPHRRSFLEAKSAILRKRECDYVNDDAKLYENQPGLLYNQFIRRRMRDYNDVEDEFLGEIVSGGYDRKSKTWRIVYEGVANEDGIEYAEELKTVEVLSSLVL